jgi:hypothetical protein
MQYSIQTDKGRISISDELILKTVTTLASNLTNMNLKNIQMSLDENNYIFNIFYHAKYNSTFISDLNILNKQLIKLIKSSFNINNLILKIYLEN